MGETRMNATRQCVVAAAWALVLCAAAVAQQRMFELGTVARSDPLGFVMNAYPVIARLAGGRLVCLFSVYTAEKPAKMKIASSISGDNGKTWSQPSILFDHPNAEDADPNLL